MIRRPVMILMLSIAVMVLCASVGMGVEPQKEKAGDREIESRRTELAEREAKIKKDEERLSAMRRDLDEQIDNYTRLLMKIEAALAQAGDINDKNFKRIVKDYEAMQAEDAAVRLAALPEPTAVRILLGMNPRKAGGALALIAPPKVSSLTLRMETVLKNLPVSVK